MRLLAAMAVILCFDVQGQVDSRWRILVERDTMVVGPLDDLRRYAGLRAAKNEEVRRCVWELHQQAKEVALLRSALDLSKKSDKANAQLVGDLNEALVQCVDARARAERRAKRRSPFIWGISGLAAGSVATLFLVR